MRVTVLGANGQLGTDLVRSLVEEGQEVVGLTHDEVRVEDADSVERAIRESRPEVVLNTTAFHHLPSCEEDPVRTFAVNAAGAVHVARAAAGSGAVNVYFSTDYVFDGAKGSPYLETDPPCPLNVYGASKVAGERLTRVYSPRSFVLRTSGLYGRVPCRAKGENFVVKMVRLARERPEVRVVDDEVLTPTPTAEVAERVLPIVRSGAFGTYHLTCGGACSWYDFAREIFDRLGLDAPLHRAKARDFPTPFERPAYSVLESAALAATGIEPMPDWRLALCRFLETAPLPGEP